MKCKAKDKIDSLFTLTVFKSIKRDECIRALHRAFQKNEFREQEFSNAISILLDKSQGNLTEYLKDLIRNDENFYIKKFSKGEAINQIEKNNLDRDINILDDFNNNLQACLISDSKMLPDHNSMPEFSYNECDIAKFYDDVLNNSTKNGYGKWANYNMFVLSPKGKIKPITNSQPLEIQDLYEYEREKQIIYDNTKRLVEGKLAQNVLLTGDAGCGKSSSIKAIANSFKHEGLRIIEVKKSQITQIAKLLGKLEQLNLKFIIFIDDVSYSQGDENYNALKALLEGSCVERAKNITIYATSNRRHMIAEKFSDRDGDDMHVNDVIQEQISLSDRFGIHVTFSRPSKEVYLEIVKKLAHKHHVKTSSELLAEAEKFALVRGGRSARVAKQFIEMQE